MGGQTVYTLEEILLRLRERKCYVDYVGHVPDYKCTLKCKKCFASIPYLKEKNPTGQQLKDEIDLFFSKVDYCYIYDCTGGETFLVSDVLAEVLEYLVLNYGGRIGEIMITTNATVIPSEKMLDFLTEYKEAVRINVSTYHNVPGWQEKYAKFFQVFLARHIPIVDVGTSRWIDFGFGETTLHKTEKELAAYFERCENFCRLYQGGIEYYCGHGHNAYKAFYPECMEKQEGLDYHDASVTKEVIVEWHMGYQDKGYLEICDHCNGWVTTNRNFIPVAEQIENKVY